MVDDEGAYDAAARRSRYLNLETSYPNLRALPNAAGEDTLASVDEVRPGTLQP